MVEDYIFRYGGNPLWWIKERFESLQVWNGRKVFKRIGLFTDGGVDLVQRILWEGAYSSEGSETMYLAGREWGSLIFYQLIYIHT